MEFWVRSFSVSVKRLVCTEFSRTTCIYSSWRSGQFQTIMKQDQIISFTWQLYANNFIQLREIHQNPTLHPFLLYIGQQILSHIHPHKTCHSHQNSVITQQLMIFRYPLTFTGSCFTAILIPNHSFAANVLISIQMLSRKAVFVWPKGYGVSPGQPTCSMYLCERFMYRQGLCKIRDPDGTGKSAHSGITFCCPWWNTEL